MLFEIQQIRAINENSPLIIQDGYVTDYIISESQTNVLYGQRDDDNAEDIPNGPSSMTRQSNLSKEDM